MSKLKLAIGVYKLLAEPEVHSRTITGVLPEHEYQKYKNQLEDSGLLVRYKDESCSLEFTLPSETNSIFAMNMTDLLQAPSRLLQPPAEFYLAEEDCYFERTDQTDVPQKVLNYLDVSLFALTLSELADFNNLMVPKAIFLHGEKLELSLKYTEDDLRELNGLQQFITDLVKADIHKNQKNNIIKDVLLEMLKNSEIDRFTVACLVQRFDEFVERVNANYQLYVSEFSFDKIRDQFEREEFEFTLKLNKVFSGIQNQLLAVPVALILIGTQMQSADGFSIKNTSVWLGSLIFSLFMSLLIRNQLSTLKALKMEIDSQWMKVQGKHKFVAEKLGSHYAQLRARYRSQRLFLGVVSFIVSITAVIGSTALFLYSSQSTHLYKEIIYWGGIGGVVYIAGCAGWLMTVTRMKVPNK